MVLEMYRINDLRLDWLKIFFLKLNENTLSLRKVLFEVETSVLLVVFVRANLHHC